MFGLPLQAKQPES